MQAALFVGGGIAALFAARWARARLLLSRAKHPSLRGHARMARRISKWIPYYEYDGEEFFAADDAPESVQQQRRASFERLAEQFARKAPKTLAYSGAVEDGLADVEFVNRYRVPFQFRERVRKSFRLGLVVQATRDLGASTSALRHASAAGRGLRRRPSPHPQARRRSALLLRGDPARGRGPPPRDRQDDGRARRQRRDPRRRLRPTPRRGARRQPRVTPP